VTGFLCKHRAFAAVSLSCGTVLALLVLGYVAWGNKSVRFEGFLTIDCAIYVLGSASYLVLCAPKRRRFLPLVILAWWLAVELVGAPHLVSTLSLWHYGIMQDVDHRPLYEDAEHNSDSLRATPESSEFHPDGMNILFLGDSFTMGAGVEGREAFPALTGQALRESHPSLDIQVANCGWISSSPLLSYRLLAKIGDKYKPKIVVMCVDMTDFDDDIKYQHMLDRDGLYAWYDRIPITLHYFRILAPETYAKLVSWSVGGAPEKRFFITEAPLGETRRWFEPLVSNVRKIREWCRVRGADFVLVVLPRAYQFSARECPNNWEKDEYTLLGPYSLEPFRYFDELRGSTDFPIVSLLPEFQSAQEFPLCFDADPHWNAAGHRVAARGIARELEPIVARRAGR
jgi:hypothetical protein